MLAHAQQTQVNPNSGSFRTDADSKCPPAFKKVTKQGNIQDPNYRGPDKLFFCAPKNSEKLIKKSRSNPLSMKGLPFLSLDDFGAAKTDESQNPIRQALSKAEQEQLEVTLGELNFPNYLLSGCHDRAHAAYMLLSEEIKDKAMKVWVVAPSAYTRGVKGTIGLQGNPGIKWRYHVALAFQTSKGIVVYDAGLAPNKLISEQDWFALAEYPALSFRTYTAGEAYLFYDEETPINMDFWNCFGDAFCAVGRANSNHES